MAEGWQRSLHICRVVPRREIGKHNRCPGVGQRRDRGQRDLRINQVKPKLEHEPGMPARGYLGNRSGASSRISSVSLSASARVSRPS